MFLTRTVAAEVLLDLTKSSDAYTALKEMGRTGLLRFDLSAVAQELMTSFFKSAAVTYSATKTILRQIFTDFPSEDAVARSVMIAVVLIPAIGVHTGSLLASKFKAEFDALRLVPTREEILNVLLHPFMDRLTPVIEFIRSDEGLRMQADEVNDFAKEAAVRCLELGFKVSL
jgi:hypothetical protein